MNEKESKYCNGWNEFAEWIGVECNKPFWVDEMVEQLIISNKGVGYYNENDSIDYDRVLITHLIEGILTPLKYPPEETALWTLEPSEDSGYTCLKWDGSYWMKNLWNRNYIYLSEKAVRKAIKDMGWDTFQKEKENDR